MSYEPPQPVGPIDPNALTQPIPPVQPPPAAAPPPQSTPGAYVPKFGNFGVYLLTRWLAFVVDFVILPFAMATFAFQLYDRGVVAFAPRSIAGFTVLMFVAFGGALFFVLLFEALFGTSFGKALFALGVRRTNGMHPGLGRTLIRYALMPLDLLLIGPLLILLPPRHGRLGDFASGTVVARNRIGVFATVLGALLLGGLVYAQVIYGGGVNSAIGVMAEGTAYGPPLVSEIAHAVGLGSFVPVIPVPAPSGAATGSAATAAPATEATTPASASSVEPSSAPVFATPVPTAEPSVEAAPTSASTGLIRG